MLRTAEHFRAIPLNDESYFHEWQTMEVSSNQELFRQDAPFKWSPNEWYHLKTRVDVAADGTGMIRAKAWKKTDPEPDAWTATTSLSPESNSTMSTITT